MKKQKGSLFRISAFAVSIMMAVAFMPVFDGAWAFAEDDASDIQIHDEIIVEGVDAADEESTDAVAEPIQEKAAAAEPAVEAEKATKEKAPLKQSALKRGDGGDIDADSAIEIAPGDQILCEASDDSEFVTYKFTAPKNGTYIFYTREDPDSGSSDPDGSILVYEGEEGEYTEIDSDSDYGDINLILNAEDGQTYCFRVKFYSGSSAYVYFEEDIFDASITAKVDKSTGKATVSGTATGDTFDSLYVDGEQCNVDISGKETFSVTVNMKNFDVGYHDMYAVLTKHSDDDYWVYNATGVPTYIYKAPTNYLSYYWTGNKKFKFSYDGSTYKNCKVVLEYKKVGGAWKKTKALTPGKVFTKTKLAIGKTYKVRTYFVYSGTYKGKKYTFTGKNMGKVSKTQSIKTAAAKPKIKSIKITGAKITSSTYRQPIYYYNPWGGITIDFVNGPLVTEYNTTATVTVKLKKKPGAAGIYINGKLVKGNKKVYKAKVTFDGKKKGKKVTIKVYSYQSTKYKGYSPKASKKVKIKK